MTSTRRVLLAPAHGAEVRIVDGLCFPGATVTHEVGFAPADRWSQCVVAEVDVVGPFPTPRVAVAHPRIWWRDGDARGRSCASRTRRRSSNGVTGRCPWPRVGIAHPGAGGAMVTSDVGSAPAHESMTSGGAMVTRDVGFAPADHGWRDE